MWNAILHTKSAGHRPLEASSEQFKGLFESLPAATWIIDLAGRYLHVSLAFADMVGRTPAQCVGMTLDDVMPPSMARVFEQRHQQLLGTRSPRRFEQIWPIDGEPRWFEIRMSCLFDEDQQATGIAGYAQDITQYIEQQESAREIRNELEQRVMQRTHQLSIINDELEAFSYSVSHDLRAPLRQIAGFAELLGHSLTSSVSEPDNQYLRQIIDNSQRMDGLISDLLQLARINQGGLLTTRLELTGIVQQEIDALRAQDPDRVIEITMPAQVYARCDAGLMHIALANLLGNAWKFTRKQSRPHIQFGHFPRGNYTVYFVRDNGAGFDMKHASRIFGAFQRFHRACDFPGTGIGLATVKRIVSRHGGHIWAESAPNEGATFYFTLETPT